MKEKKSIMKIKRNNVFKIIVLCFIFIGAFLLSNNAHANISDFEISNGKLVRYKGSDSNVVIPNNVTSIEYGAFKNCIIVKSITIPNSVTSIEYRAFENCISLEKVLIPSSVKNIGSYAFYNCESLITISIPNGVTNIGDGAFDGCDKLISITIPNSVTIIGTHAFGMWTNTKITIYCIEDSAAHIYAVNKGIKYRFGDDILLSSINITESKILNIYDSFTIIPTLIPSNAINKTLSFKSSDRNIATVNNKGVVTAKKAGTAIITVATTDGSNIKAYCRITVKKDYKWKVAYIDYINNLDEERFMNYNINKGTYDWSSKIFSLIDMNGDKIPELIIEGNSIASGRILCSYYNGKVYSSELSSYCNLYYFKGKNLLLESGGRMGGYRDIVYSLKKGRLKKKVKGKSNDANWHNLKTKKTVIDPYSGGKKGIYVWKNKKIRKKKYNQKLKRVFNYKKAKKYKSKYRKKSIITKIKSY